jgi:HAD superfamily hydrolase (TIGR01549 family)
MEKLKIFDFDGTIADTTKVVEWSFKYLFNRYKLNGFSSQWVASHSGIALEDIVKGMIKDYNLPESSYDIMLKEFRDYQLNFFFEEVKLFPDVVPLLKMYREQNCKICLLSNRSEMFFEEYFRQQGILDYFDLILGRESVKKSKPDPEGVNIIKQKYPQIVDLTLIGDTPVDIQTAKNANIKSIAVSTGKHSFQELLKSHPNLLVNNLNELIYTQT